MSKIKFGTDGWRAIIAEDFTVYNVARVTESTAKWLRENYENPSAVIGHDCRFGGELFARTVANYLAQNGIKVYIADGFVSTPMVSLGTKKIGASAGIIITASHNPHTYNGYKLKGHYGGPLLVEDIQKIEDGISEELKIIPKELSFEEFQKNGLIEYIDLESMYKYEIQKNFDLELIKSSGIVCAYDAMYGAGQDVMKSILPDAAFFRCENNPTFYGISPEPIMKNLGAFSDFIKDRGDIDVALTTDGDADRIGLLNGDGEFIDSHHIILLLILYFVKYKKETGKVCTGFSSTVKIQQLCDKYNLPLDIVPIGFKHICGIMIEEDVLVGGEESGGIAIRGHIPERDGIWIGLTILEFMAKSGKSIKELVAEVYAEIGEFAFQRIDLKLTETQKTNIVNKCKGGEYKSFGQYQVQNLETLDGFKFYFNEDEWVMIRPSGTEPVLRTYAESKNKAGTEQILKATHETILN
jgi:phosphomannomutase